ncbi:restriction endonuclease subunit S [Cryobacterium sp. PH31-L1]|uniref:restriction endonuclease subunit S n=1 Tax=Cryobacterium sp. PH31-L1 TaxID=3046199 RepID=UPI0024BAA02B|nr:restriction endonuclease subunit S [Cryobacterium sp. PH31-L1]MDJ0379082.1 restriction endonuclease subunit S [Cryobacterium sp. PH31-L1]
MREGWERRAIGEVTSVLRRGITPRYVKPDDSDALVVVNQKCINSNYVDLKHAKLTERVRALSDDRYLKRGDTLVCSTGRGTLGRSALWLGELESTADSHVTIVRPGDDILPEYLAYVLSTAEDELVSRGTGSTNMTELSAGAIADIPLWVPPIAEQRRIVDLIGAVDEIIGAAREHEVISARVLTQLRETMLTPSAGWKQTKIGNELLRVRRPVEVETTAEYAEIGTRSYGRGVFLKEPVKGAALGSKKVFYVAPGDLVFNIVFAWEGSVALLGEESQGRIASHRFPTFQGSQVWSVEYFNHFFGTAHGRDLLVQHSPGGAGRNKTLSVPRLLEAAVQVPADAESADSILATLRAAAACAQTSARHTVSAGNLRSHLLSALLAGTHEIPASYDRLLKGVSA